MNKSKITVAIINSITALVCCAAIAIGGTTITGRICSNKEDVASKRGTAVSAQADVGGADDSSVQISDDGTATVSTDPGTDATSTDQPTGGDTAADAPQGDTAQTAGKPDSNAPAKVITATSGLESTDKAEVLKYYQLVAAKNEKKLYKTQMGLKDLNGGSGLVGSIVSAIKPLGEKALAKNSNESEGIPGEPKTIKTSDWKTAKATNDGTYTTIYVTCVEQTDGANGKTNEGTVGRSIGVLDGVQTAIDEMGGGLSADFANAKDFRLVYKDAYFKVKIKNSTGEFVKGSCEWHHSVNVFMDGLTAKIGILSATFKGATAVIDYKVTY